MDYGFQSKYQCRDIVHSWILMKKLNRRNTPCINVVRISLFFILSLKNQIRNKSCLARLYIAEIINFLKRNGMEEVKLSRINRARKRTNQMKELANTSVRHICNSFSFAWRSQSLLGCVHPMLWLLLSSMFVLFHDVCCSFVCLHNIPSLTKTNSQVSG